jgi:mannose-6-phosphate isomerase-like protein (cupin superfamily)
MISTKIDIAKGFDNPEESIVRDILLPGEILGLQVIFLSIGSEKSVKESTDPTFYDVLITLYGEALLEVGEESFSIGMQTIVRIPYGSSYMIKTKKGETFKYIRFRKLLNNDDRQLISKNGENYTSVYIKRFIDCPAYTEDIKSSKTLNRMLLPEGLVPRFCAGLVETAGPDEVKEHDHPMLDQLFFGLDKCKCTCSADGEQVLLTENMLLHIPLGSKHSVSVDDGEILSYIWFDFFLTLEGQKYMGEQHQVKQE